MAEVNTVLSESEVEEIQRRAHKCVPSDILFLCATVKVLRAKLDRIKNAVAWHRDGVGPDVPVLQERYDKLIAQRDDLTPPEGRDKAAAEAIAALHVGNERLRIECAKQVISALATVRAEVWRDAILTVDTAPLCHCAGKQYVDPVALVQQMNAALESARGKVEG